LVLTADDAPRLAGIGGGAVNEVQKHPGPFDMTKEPVADAGAFCCTLNQTGNVGNDEFAALVADDAELRTKRGERIVADLCTGVADRVQEGGLARIGQADEA